MPLQDLRTGPATVGNNTARGHGKPSVQYRRADGRTEEAIVLGPGTNSGYRIKLVSRRPSVVLDDVPLATGMKSTNAIFNRRV